MTETGLITRDAQAQVGIFLPPEVVLENARTAARALQQVISQKAKPVILNGEQYLEFDDWQTCGQFYGYTVKTGDATPVEVAGVKGAKATADLIDIKTGMYLGGAEAYCMRDEEHWNTRPKYEWQGEGKDRKRVKVGEEVVPWFQLASMAQTRAGAKAFRNRLAWVVVLAGYKPTPAEEMTENTVSPAVQERRTVDETTRMCPIHGVPFFKKGKMKAYAHPVGDGTWCNERDADDKATEEIARAMSAVEGEPGHETPIFENEAQAAEALSEKPAMDEIGPGEERNFRSLGDFMQQATAQFDLSPSELFRALSIKNERGIVDPSKAWADLVRKQLKGELK